MTFAIMLFEVRQRLHSLSAYIYFTVVFLLGFLFVVTTGGAFGLAPSGAFGSSGRVLINSPFILNQVMGSISLICIIITSALAGQLFSSVRPNASSSLHRSSYGPLLTVSSSVSGHLACRIASGFWSVCHVMLQWLGQGGPAGFPVLR